MPRRLAAILVADVVGYSRLMEADEAGTLAALSERRKMILEPTVRERGGSPGCHVGNGLMAGASIFAGSPERPATLFNVRAIDTSMDRLRLAVRGSRQRAIRPQ